MGCGAGGGRMSSTSFETRPKTACVVMQVCLVGRKVGDPAGLRRGAGQDVIYSERRGQSQKPEEIYQLIEELVPNGQFPCCSLLNVKHLPAQSGGPW